MPYNSCSIFLSSVARARLRHPIAIASVRVLCHTRIFDRISNTRVRARERNYAQWLVVVGFGVRSPPREVVRARPAPPKKVEVELVLSMCLQKQFPYVDFHFFPSARRSEFISVLLSSQRAHKNVRNILRPRALSRGIRLSVSVCVCVGGCVVGFFSLITNFSSYSSLYFFSLVFRSTAIRCIPSRFSIF